MPVFDLKCLSCGEVETNVYHRADDSPPLCKCGGERVHHWGQAPVGNVFKAGWYEHVATEPKYFGSKAELRAFCRDNGMISYYAE